MTMHTAARTTRSTRSTGSAGWVPFTINLAIAEYVIRRPARRRAIISRPAINSRSIRATAKVGSS